MKRLSTILAASVLTGLAAACLDDDITGTRPLAFSLTSSGTTAVVDQEVTFSYDAQGTGLRIVRINYGDGVSDSTTFRSSTVSGAGDLTHSFTMAGTFVVRGEAQAQAGVAKDSVVVTIN